MNRLFFPHQLVCSCFSRCPQFANSFRLGLFRQGRQFWIVNFERNKTNNFRKVFCRFQHSSSKSKPGSGPSGNRTVEGPSSAKNPRKSEIFRLFALTKPVRLRLAGGIVLLVISSCVTMSVPFFMGKIIDSLFSPTTKQETPSTSSDSGEPRSADGASRTSPSTSGFFPLKGVILRPGTPYPGVSTPEEAIEVEIAPDKSKESMSKIGRLCVLLVPVFVLGAAANFGRLYLMQTAAQKVINKLRTNVFSSIIKQEMGFFDATKTGELVNRLSNDATIVGHSITMNISNGLRSLAMAAGGAVMMFVVSPKLGVIGLALVPPVALAGAVYGRIVRRIVKQLNDALAASTQVAEERISNIRIVRAFGGEKKEDLEYSKKIQEVLSFARSDAFARSSFFAFAGLSGNLILLTILYTGGSLIADGSLTIGQLSSFLLYAVYVGASIQGLTGFYSEMMRGAGCSIRLFELVDKKELIPLTGGVTPPSVRGEVVFENVSFAYPMRAESVVFDDLSLTVPAGMVTALVGPSGSGKSTVASLLLRFYDPDGGRILLDGNDIKSLDATWLRKNVGTVTQEPVLFSCTVRENIAYGADSPEEVDFEAIKRAARQANAFDFILSFPKGFNTLVGEKGLGLSGGQRQRIAIARALLNNPKLLIFDEATSALDTESEHNVKMALKRLLSEGRRTVLIIAHRLSTVMNADQIAVISEGRVRELGTYKELMSIESGIFKKLVERQTEDSFIE